MLYSGTTGTVLRVHVVCNLHYAVLLTMTAESPLFGALVSWGHLPGFSCCEHGKFCKILIHFRVSGVCYGTPPPSPSVSDVLGGKSKCCK